MEGVEDAPVPNISELEVDNATNLTGRAAATTEGMIVTYSALFIMALGPIFLGSLRSVSYHSSMRVRRLQGLCRVGGSGADAGILKGGGIFFKKRGGGIQPLTREQFVLQIKSSQKGGGPDPGHPPPPPPPPPSLQSFVQCKTGKNGVA